MPSSLEQSTLHVSPTDQQPARALTQWPVADLATTEAASGEVAAESQAEPEAAQQQLTIPFKRSGVQLTVGDAVRFQLVQATKQQLQAHKVRTC